MLIAKIALLKFFFGVDCCGARRMCKVIVVVVVVVVVVAVVAVVVVKVRGGW